MAPPPPPAATNFLALPFPPPHISSPATGLTVCVVVPCVPIHLEYLPDVLASLDGQTEAAAQVVVALSETNGDECALVVAALRTRTTTPLTLSCVAEPVSAGSTRSLCPCCNRSARLSRSAHPLRILPCTTRRPTPRVTETAAPTSVRWPVST